MSPMGDHKVCLEICRSRVDKLFDLFQGHKTNDASETIELRLHHYCTIFHNTPHSGVQTPVVNSTCTHTLYVSTL